MSARHRQCMGVLSLVNGVRTDALSVRDRGFLYGDGLFETMRFRQRCLPLWDWHWARLLAGAECLQIACARTRIEADLQTLWAQPDLPSEGVVRLTLSRGEGGFGYAGEPVTPTCVLSVSGLPPAAPMAGVTVRRCQWRLPRQPGLAGIKHLNRLDQVMARREWSDPDIFDGLLLDMEDGVIESTTCNLFLRHGEQWLTPDLGAAGVAGVMRAWLLAVAFPAQGQAVACQPLSWDALLAADELFLCNSVRGIVPVQALQAPARRWQPGPLTHHLMRTVQELFSA